MSPGVGGNPDGLTGYTPLSPEPQRSEGGRAPSRSVVAGFGNLPWEVLCLQGFLCLLCWLAPCPPSFTRDWEEGTGGGGLPKTPTRLPGGWEGLWSLRVKGEQPLFPKMTFNLLPKPVRLGADLCAGFGGRLRLQGHLCTPSHLRALCVVLVPAPSPTGSCPGRPQTFQLVQRAEAGPQSCRAHPISSGPEVCCPPRRPAGTGGEEGPQSAAHAEGGQQGPELEGPVGTLLWGADSWPGPAALWAALLGWQASCGPLGWGAAERQHPGVGWGSQRQAVVLCPSAPALVGGLAGQAGPASWAGSLRVKASAPSRSPSGPFFHLIPRNPAFVG